jgi:TadE-like protein
MRQRRGRGQALVELALVVPLLLLFAFGTLGVSRVVRAHMALSAAAHEAARAAALSPLPLGPDRGETTDAKAAGVTAGQRVAAGFGLLKAEVKITFDNGDHIQPGGWATAHVEATLDENYFKFLHWRGITLQGDDREQVDRFRNRG